MKYFSLVLLIFVLFLVGCSQFGIPSNNNRENPAFQCPSFKEGRGVVADFIEYSPPEEIKDGREFSLGLKFANHFVEPTAVELHLQDTTDMNGFPDEGVSQQVVVEGATAEKNIWYRPGCRITGEQNFAELDLGPYSYSPILFDDVITFKGYIQYDAFTDASLFICAFNPAAGPGTSCSTKESSSESALGWRNSKAPIAVTSVERLLIGSKDGVDVKLDLEIENEGGGYVGGDGSIDFSLSAQGMTFTCESEQAGFEKGEHMTLKLDREKSTVQVHCESFLNLDRTEAFDTRITLHYPYVYSFDSIPVTLKRGNQAG